MTLPSIQVQLSAREAKNIAAALCLVGLGSNKKVSVVKPYYKSGFLGSVLLPD